MSPERRFVVLNDAPLGDGADEDLLEVTAVARGLTDLIVASRDSAPFTLAVDAAWGMGKSSLLHRLETTLCAEPAVSSVWFNAWTSGGASALEGLIKSVLLRFDRNVIRRALRSMSRRAHLIGVVRGLGLVVASFFGLGRVVDEMWQRMSLDAQARNQIKGVLRDAFGAWMAKGGAPDGRRLLVVFVDDLDRCASERVIEVCEAIKLYLDVPGVVFVLACDQSALWRSVQESAGIGEPAAAVEYLEKIVQISYRIPAPSPEQATRLVDGYLYRSGTSGLFDEALKYLIIARSGRNPRRIKRLINSFVLEYHLNRSWAEIGLENLVKVILLQHFYPDFYRLLVNPRSTDLISEFLEYHEFRATLRQGGNAVGGLLESKGLHPGAGLAELEAELPAEYPVLAVDRDFVALLRSIGEPGDLVNYLQRNPLSTVLPPAELRQGSALRGFRVLWIDDNPSHIAPLVEYLQSRGALVDVAADRAGALAVFERSTPHAVVSDLHRGADDAGTTDLAHFRGEGAHYRGPVLFFTSREPGAAVQSLVRDLDAEGPTTDADAVIRWVERIAALTRVRPG
ncbi:P-loop NTPase fold protein [Amycolatopsis sp. cmx-4-68]|uniref:P-loop NTPase fold protein n=1 Tax=Amycolatopsis sp. cmx-4-68 TaxID=2790938 RepID=UPI0039797123